TADVIKQQQKVGAARLPNGGRKCSCGFVYWKEIVWAKTTLDCGRIRGGTGYHYRAASERILFFEKGKRALNDLGIPDVLMAPRAGVPGPAVKPGAVVRTLIAQSTAPGELVLDPFCGSGGAGAVVREPAATSAEGAGPAARLARVGAERKAEIVTESNVLQLVPPPRQFPELISALRSWDPGGIGTWVLAAQARLPLTAEECRLLAQKMETVELSALEFERVIALVGLSLGLDCRRRLTVGQTIYGKDREVDVL